MTASQILGNLKLTRQAVDEDIARVDDSIASLQREREALMRLREVLPDRANGSSPDRAVTAPTQPRIQSITPPPRAGSRRDQYVGILKQRPTSLWTPREVKEAFDSQGINLTINNVRNTLRRMGKIGRDVERVGDRYRLAPELREAMEAERERVREE